MDTVIYNFYDVETTIDEMLNVSLAIGLGEVSHTKAIGLGQDH